MVGCQRRKSTCIKKKSRKNPKNMVCRKQRGGVAHLTMNGLQKSNKPLLQRAPLRTLSLLIVSKLSSSDKELRGIVNKKVAAQSDIKWRMTGGALTALQRLVEERLVKILLVARDLSLTAGRNTVMESDINNVDVISSRIGNNLIGEETEFHTVRDDCVLPKNTVFKRICKRAGILRVSGEAYSSIERIFLRTLTLILRVAFAYTRNCGRHTINETDIFYAEKDGHQ
jgi:histone H3/H4